MDGEVFFSWSSCVKTARELIGLSQTDAAQRAGIDTTRWRRLETDYALSLPGTRARQPHFDTIRKVGRALCVDIQIDFPYVPAERIRYTVRYRPEAMAARSS